LYTQIYASNHLARYNHVVRGLYFDALANLPCTEMVKPNGLSFDSMRGVFLHLTLVEDRWVSYIITERFKEWVDPDFEAFKDIAALKQFMLQVQGNTEVYMSGHLADELNRQIAIPWGHRPDTKINVETALCHMVMENMVHYSELSAPLWQMGLEAPYLGFRRYKNMNPILAKVYVFSVYYIDCDF